MGVDVLVEPQVDRDLRDPQQVRTSPLTPPEQFVLEADQGNESQEIKLADNCQSARPRQPGEGQQQH